MLRANQFLNNSVTTLTSEERAAVAKIIEQLPHPDFERLGDCDFSEIELVGRQLPYRIAKTLVDFRRAPCSNGYLLFENLPCDPLLPRTPPDGRPSNLKQTFVSELCLLLFLLFLGEPIAYADEKEGALIQNICPLKGQESLQENTGCDFLEFHTEDGFHPHKPDYLGLICLKPDHDFACKTSTSSIRNVLSFLPSTAIELLRKPLYRLKLSSSFMSQGVELKNDYSDWLPILTGSLTEPDMCIDYFLMDSISKEGQWALDFLKNLLTSSVVSHILKPGDLLIIDNRIAAHARSAFKPRYDGNDRWLQRMFVLQDYRKTSFSRFPGRRVCTPLYAEKSSKSSTY